MKTWIDHAARGQCHTRWTAACHTSDHLRHYAPSFVDRSRSSVLSVRAATWRCQHSSACRAQPQLRHRGPQVVPAVAAASAAAAAPTDEQLTASAVLLEQVTTCDTYDQLTELTKKFPDVLLHGPLNVYVLLQAARLRGTLDQDLSSAEEAVQHLQTLEQAEELITSVADALVPTVPRLPLVTQGAVALALTQLQYYNASVFEAIAASVQSAFDSATPSSSSSKAASEAAGPMAASGLLSKQFSQLPADALPGVVLTLVAGFSLSGYYSDQLFAGLMDEVLVRKDAFQDMDNLVAICSALLDVQHYTPAVLQLAASRAAKELPDLESSTIVSLLLALAFFRTCLPGKEGSRSSSPAPGSAASVSNVCVAFAKQALEELSSREDLAEDLDPKHAAQLWRACVLLAAQNKELAAPAGVLEALQETAEQGELLLLAPCPGATDRATIDKLKEDAAAMYDEWEAAGLLAPAEMLEKLQQQGHTLDRYKRAVYGSKGGSGSEQKGEGGGVEWVSVPVDLSLATKGRDVAVMVLSTERYCMDPPNRLRGTAALDISVLQALGWAVLPLPLGEWEALEAGGSAREDYLKARLKAALA